MPDTQSQDTSVTETVDNILRWRPNKGPQEFALRIPDVVFEIMFGGSRGGGKTAAGIMWLIKPIEQLGWKPTITHPLFRALVLRRNANDLTDWIDRADRIFSAYGGKLVKHPQAYWTFPSGAKIYAGHLRDADSYTKYQGHEYQRMLIEELTQIKSEMLYTKLIGSCRSTIAEIKPQIFLTTNPGGVGHSWVRERFINAATPGKFFMNPKTNRHAIFVPANIEDNPKLIEADPEYVQWLESLKNTDERLYMAWRHGSWDVFEGAIFTEWNYFTHVYPNKYFDVPVGLLASLPRISSFDWGFRDPASMHWMAKLPENEYGVEHIVIYRELYRTQMTAGQWGQLMGRVSGKNGPDPIDYMVLPHDCFSTRPDGQTIAKVMRRESGIPVRPAENLTSGAKLNRIALMHQCLSLAPDGLPYLLVHETCKDLIRTVPELIYDETLTEQINRNAEEHAFDSATYGLNTIKPKFAEPGLIQMQPPKPVILRPGLTQKPTGEVVPANVLDAVAQPDRVRPGAGEF